MNTDGGDGDERGSGWGATLGGVLAAVAIVALGIWLVNEMADSAKYAKCAAARHRNCDTIDYRAPTPQK
jgi:hypothetical protein